MAFGKPSPASRASNDDAEGAGSAPPSALADEEDQGIDPEEALALAEQAEAEAAAAEAAAAAARARAEAARLRREAARAMTADRAAGSGADKTGADGTGANGGESGPPEESGSAAVEAPPIELAAPDSSDTTPAAGARRRFRLRWGIVARAAAIVAICLLLAASGYMVWYHQQVEAEKQRAAEFAAAARQGIVSLMSLDFNRAEEDVQRIIDNSTGEFREEFESAAEDFATVAKESKVITDVSVNATAVQSMTEDSAEVLVAATSSITNEAGANQDPRSWRLFVSVTRDDGQLKMSKVEFVP
jgi:Mce-associated membrane protein